MKHTRKLLLILAVMVSLMLAVGGTMAYLQDTDEDVNVMTLGNVYIDQLEYERVNVDDDDPNTLLQTFRDGKPLYPAVITAPDGTDPWYTSDKSSLDGSAYITWDQIGREGSWQHIWDTNHIRNEVDKFVFVKNTGASPAYVRTWFAFEMGMLETPAEWLQKFHIVVNTSVWNTLEVLESMDFEVTTIGDQKYLVACLYYTGNDGILEPGKMTNTSLCQYALDPSADNELVESFGDTYEILVKSQAVQTAGFPNAETALNEAFGTEHPFADDMVEKEKEELEFLETHPVEYNGVRFETLQEGVDAAAENGGGVVKVHVPLKIAETVEIPEGLAVTIDGMGNTVSRADGFGSTVISVANGAELTMKDITVDGGAVWSGAIDETLQRSLTNTGMTGSGSLIATVGNGKVVLEQDTVLQNNDGASAVSLATRGGGSLTMNGASIINNNAVGGGAVWGGGSITINAGSKMNGNYASSIGGAIRMVDGYNLITFTMNGGEMNHNKSDGTGGAIWGGNRATYVFNGGEMAYNFSAGGGGAIWTGNYETYKFADGFSLTNNSSTEIGGAIRFSDHASLTMTGGYIADNEGGGDADAFYLNNNSATITGGTINDNFTYSGGLGLTVGDADINGVIYFNLSTNHKTAYLAATFDGVKFIINGDHFDNFNFKPADGYTYTNGDESKLVCLNEGYETYWDSNSKLFKLRAKK